MLVAEAEEVAVGLEAVRDITFPGIARAEVAKSVVYWLRYL